jgi:Domain of unknown function (DUF6532)
LFWKDVKNLCDKAVEALVNPKMRPAEIASSVEQQLLDYMYIFPSVSILSLYPDLQRAKRSTQGGLVGPVTRTHPYQNPVIIRVIHDMYFTGGPNSFAAHHNDQFECLEDHDGTTLLEVPKAMVALVATAVSYQSVEVMTSLTLNLSSTMLP